MNKAEKRQQVVDHYLDYYALAMSMLDDDDDARDAVQEAMARTFAQPLVKDPVSYCFQAVRRLALDILRRRQKMIPMSKAGYINEPANVEDNYAELLKRVRSVRNGLPLDMRPLVVLHYEKGLSLLELEKLTGVSRITLWRKLQKAKEMMKTQLEEGEEI